MRLPIAFVLACLISLALFWLMQWLVTPPIVDAEPPPEQSVVQLVHMQPPLQDPDQPPKAAAAAGGGGSPAAPRPPPVPGLARPSGIPIPAPEVDADTVLPDLDFEPQLSSSYGLGSAFGGFGAGGTGGGFGGGSGSGWGRGSGPGSGGPDLVPLSTARPQIPESACRKGIEGWAAVEFNVTAAGRVSNIKILDSRPRGVFERAMIESIQYWLYKANDEGKAYRVRWKFEFKLEDCKLNWRS